MSNELPDDFNPTDHIDWLDHQLTMMRLHAETFPDIAIDLESLIWEFQTRLNEKNEEIATLKKQLEQPVKLPAFKPGDRVTSTIRAFREDVGTIVDYRHVSYLIHWDGTADDLFSVIDEKDLKGE